MPEDRNGKTYSFDVCSKCKLICCQDANPPLTLNRKKILRDSMKKQNISLETLFTDEKYSHPATDKNGFCIFYEKETRKCRAHQVKPETCRAGPVTFDINLKTRMVEFYLKKSEICLFARVLFENKELFKLHLDTAKAEIMQLIRELDEDALKAILLIPEPQTFKVAEDKLPEEILQKLGIV
jgi:Fe-S-cluster containining protein